MKKLIPFLTMVLLSTSIAFSQYPRNQQIMAAEYFLNTDPGEGNGIKITITTSPDLTINLSNLNVATGTKIYVRFQSTNGFWSAPRCIVHKEYFSVTGAALQYGEYFINTDPGQGNATPINFSVGEINLNNQILHQGDIVYFRVKDSYNRWSPARGFRYQFKEMRRAEYKIKLGSTGNFTTPVYLPTTAAPDSTSLYSCIKNNINWHINDSIFLRYQTMGGFYSQWTNGIVADAGNDTTICSGESAWLKATGGQSYLWSDGQAGSSIIVAPEITTKYGVLVSSGPGITSVDSVMVYVTPLPPIPVILQNGNTLISNASSGNQWYYNGTLIPGATNQTYTPTKNGNYFVIVTLNGCNSSASNSLSFTVGVETLSLSSKISIYPNPANVSLFIRSESIFINAKIILLDINSRILLQQNLLTETTEIDISGFNSGVYFVKIQSKEGVGIWKVFKD